MNIVYCTLAEWLERGPSLVAAGAVIGGITDRVPGYTGRRFFRPCEGRYYWQGVGETLPGVRLAQLPDHIWDRLRVARPGEDCYYDTADEADADLRRACYDWAAAAAKGEA